MGVEYSDYICVNGDYAHVPKKGNAKRVPNILVGLGAVRRDPTDSSRWIMKGQDCWADIELNAPVASVSSESHCAIRRRLWTCCIVLIEV